MSDEKILWQEVLVDFQNAAELFQGLTPADKDVVAAVMDRDHRPALRDLLARMDEFNTSLNLVRQRRK